MFTIITPAQSRTRQNGYVTIFFLQHSYVFVLKVRESLIKQLKITVKKIFESTLRVRKTSNSPKNSSSPLLKLPNTELGSLVASLRTADVFAVVEATTANMSAVRRLGIR